MGMTIERAQSIIQAARRNIAYFQEVNIQEKTEMTIEELKTKLDKSNLDSDILIELARYLEKYQKIEEILNDDRYYEDYGSNAERFIVSAISEVVEDGKID